MADDRPSDRLVAWTYKYVVVGGFALRAANYIRSTMDVDLVVAADADNEAQVFAAVATLPDHAARELQPGELQQFAVIRVADEILVDLMRAAGGIEYAEAAQYMARVEQPIVHRDRRRPGCRKSIASVLNDRAADLRV
jgi:hypothetical protein